MVVKYSTLLLMWFLFSIVLQRVVRYSCSVPWAWGLAKLSISFDGIGDLAEHDKKKDAKPTVELKEHTFIATSVKFTCVYIFWETVETFIV